MSANRKHASMGLGPNQEQVAGFLTETTMRNGKPYLRTDLLFWMIVGPLRSGTNGRGTEFADDTIPTAFVPLMSDELAAWPLQRTFGFDPFMDDDSDEPEYEGEYDETEYDPSHYQNRISDINDPGYWD